MYRAFTPAENIISPMLATVPAYCGKFCLVWPALVSLLTNEEIRKKLAIKNKNENEAFKTKVIIKIICKFFSINFVSN